MYYNESYCFVCSGDGTGGWWSDEDSTNSVDVENSKNKIILHFVSIVSLKI